MTHFLILTAVLLGQAHYERPITCFYLYRRETARKVTIYFKNSSKFLENNYPKTKSRAFWPDLQTHQQFSIQRVIFGFARLAAEQLQRLRVRRRNRRRFNRTLTPEMKVDNLL
jgi:hypothetical protein